MVYKMAQGEVDLEDNYGTAGWLGILYYYALTLLIIFIMVNVFLAIIMDSYGTAVEEAHNADSLFFEITIGVKHIVNTAAGSSLQDGVTNEALDKADADTADRKPDIPTAGHEDDIWVLTFDKLREIVDDKYTDKQLCTSIMAVYGKEQGTHESMRQLNIMTNASLAKKIDYLEEAVVTQGEKMDRILQALEGKSEESSSQ